MSNFEFNFTFGSVNQSQEEFDKSMELKSNRIKAGHHTLVIQKAFIYGMASDPKWAKLRVILSDSMESKATLTQVILIPVGGDFMYQKVGGQPTNVVAATKTLPFFKAIGEPLSPSNYPQVMGKLFNTFKKGEAELFTENGRETVAVNLLTNLIGKSLTVDLGYQGAHIQKNQESGMLEVILDGKAVEKDGKKLESESFDELKMLAQSKGIGITNLEIVKYYEAEKVADPFADL